MWVVIEHHYDQLEEAAKAWVTAQAKGCGAGVTAKFAGFYANEESPYLSIAETLIRDLQYYPQLKDRELNTRRAVVGWYQRMLKAYKPMREALLGRFLSSSEIVDLLRESIHPDNRSEPSFGAARD